MLLEQARKGARGNERRHKVRMVQSLEPSRADSCNATFSHSHLRPISREHVQILVFKGEPLFFQHFDGPYFPTLHLLHRCESQAPHIAFSS